MTTPLILTTHAWEVLTSAARWHHATGEREVRPLVRVPSLVRRPAPHPHGDSWAEERAWWSRPEGDPAEAFARYGWKYWGNFHGEDYLSLIGAPDAGQCPCGAPLSRPSGARRPLHAHPSGLPTCYGCRDECGWEGDEWRCVG